MKTIYVMTGHPCQKAPAPFLMVALNVNEGEEIAQAKLHRKFQAEDALGNYGLANLNVRFTPSDFYWAIFENPDDEKPVRASDNYYWRRK